MLKILNFRRITGIENPTWIRPYFNPFSQKTNTFKPMRILYIIDNYICVKSKVIAMLYRVSHIKAFLLVIVCVVFTIVPLQGDAEHEPSLHSPGIADDEGLFSPLSHDALFLVWQEVNFCVGKDTGDGSSWIASCFFKTDTTRLLRSNTATSLLVTDIQSAISSNNVLFSKKLTGFKLTEKSLEYLKDEGMPEEIVEALETMQGQDFIQQDDFLRALETQVGKTQSDKYKQSILERTDVSFTSGNETSKRLQSMNFGDIVFRPLKSQSVQVVKDKNKMSSQDVLPNLGLGKFIEKLGLDKFIKELSTAAVVLIIAACYALIAWMTKS